MRLLQRIRLAAVTLVTFAFCLTVAMPGHAQQPYGTAQPPSQLLLPAGAWISVRVNQQLSSKHNLPGDYFLGSLAQPLVVGGFVVARRGQTVGGRVAVAQKAGRRSGTSRLGMELIEITLVDGQQLPVVTQLMEYAGGKSVGQDAAVIATATGMGAAIGGAVDGGRGAGIGALSGAAASIIGVLVTRGRPTEVYPESVLTFRTLSPMTIFTERSLAAFQPVRQGDYDQPRLQRRAGPPPAPAYYTEYRYYSPYRYGYPYRRFSYGTGIHFYSGPRYYGRHRGGHYRPQRSGFSIQFRSNSHRGRRNRHR